MRGRGLKHFQIKQVNTGIESPPMRGRGLKPYRLRLNFHV